MGNKCGKCGTEFGMRLRPKWFGKTDCERCEMQDEITSLRNHLAKCEACFAGLKANGFSTTFIDDLLKENASLKSQLTSAQEEAVKSFIAHWYKDCRSPRMEEKYFADWQASKGKENA